MELFNILPMPNFSEVFHFEDGKENFESYAEQNGFTYWWSSNLMGFLGYETEQSFQKSLNKAMTACNTLNIPLVDNFQQVQRIVDGKTIYDWKLSRFACYLIALNGDTKKEAVAKAQAYFVTIAGAVETHLQEVEKIERLVIRDEITDREKSLSGVAKSAKVETYAYFQNAGYRGMYNMDLSRLKSMRKIDTKRSPLDFMGKEELAANLFRITQTELKIKTENIQGQRPLEVAAESVGKKVRNTMIEISSVAPEHLPVSQDIKNVRRDLKERSKALKSIDAPKKRGKK